MLHKNILEMKSNGTTHHYFSKGNDYRSLTFSRLYNKSLSLAYILSQKGIAKESPIGLILNAPDEFIISFIACTMLGNPCIPIATPNIGYNLENYSSLISQILNVSKAKTLLVGEEILSSLVDIYSNNIELLPFQTIDNFNSNYFSPAENSPDDICFYQFTSGSTGNPKGVMISYENLLNNIEGMVKRLEISSHDQIVSWLPMYHDMGFIGKVVLPIVSKTSVVYIPTSKFIRNPKVWFNAITRYNATISFVPNFSLSLICKRYMNDDLTQVDLSSIRTIGCGAEPISAKLVERFLSQFKKCGLKKTAFLPSYGMAETTLAITMSHPNLDYKQVYIDKDKYANKNISIIDKHNNRHGISLVSCGSPIDNYMVKIVN
jgi:fatty-acyl-CoA synthase